MSNKEEVKKRNKLSREILGLFGATAVISVFFYGFLNVMANAIVVSYCERNDIVLEEMLEWTIESWIQSISLGAAMFCFVVLFLFLVGQKLAYLNIIIKGVDALREHRMNYEMPLEGNNELTELAESINYLAKTESELRKKEQQMQEEKENLIHALSHDIRTPLTSILSYSEYLNGKEEIEKEMMETYIELVQQKAVQIKGLTDRLLDEKKRELEYFENGKFLMQQLAEEWKAVLEEKFKCEISFKDCETFSGEFDIQELRRIFDNLASNIEKYADPERIVSLSFLYEENLLKIEQKNGCREVSGDVESNKIGIDSIEKIAKNYGGWAEIKETKEEFMISIYLKIHL